MVDASQTLTVYKESLLKHKPEDEKNEKRKDSRQYAHN
jgi:hypothetical protein